MKNLGTHSIGLNRTEKRPHQAFDWEGEGARMSKKQD